MVLGKRIDDKMKDMNQINYVSETLKLKYELDSLFSIDRILICSSYRPISNEVYDEIKRPIWEALETLDYGYR